MRKLAAAFILAAAAFAWFSLPTPPRDPPPGAHAGHFADPKALAEGVVVALDAAAGRVTINHGPLPSVGMPPMTMGFNVSDPTLLQGIQPGDKVRFHVDTLGGAFTVMSIQAAN